MSETYSIPTSPQFKDRTGHTYGRLTVMSYAGSRKGSALWLCLCTCGTERTVLGTELAIGNSTSCGCWTQEKHKTAAKTHGRSWTAEWRVWVGIKTRCTNSNVKAYHRYGGRGITMCQRWQQSFQAFYADMGPKPSPSHSIERINNDGNYEKANCQWATPTKQSRNRRSNHRVTFMGKTLSLVEWAELQGITYGTLKSRLTNLGWSVEQALTTPVRPINLNRDQRG